MTIPRSFRVTFSFRNDIMKVEKIDFIWSAVSMVIVGVSYRRGQLIQGLILIYALMAVLFFYHIYTIRKRMKGSIAVYATVTDYHSSKGRKHSFFPIVKYETETGREITSAYSVENREMLYEIGDEEMICYDPEDPMFFYFSNRDWELTKDYYRFIVLGGIIAGLLLFYLIFK